MDHWNMAKKNPLPSFAFSDPAVCSTGLVRSALVCTRPGWLSGGNMPSSLPERRIAGGGLFRLTGANCYKPLVLGLHGVVFIFFSPTAL